MCVYIFGGLIDHCSAFGDCLQRVILVVIATRAGWAGNVCAAI